jgi:hypothetical protein
MPGRETRKDPGKPATRNNYIATPADKPLRDTTLPQGLSDADPLGTQHPRLQRHVDTETPKGSRDAGPSGSHPRVDEPRTPETWDTGVPQGPRDAGPSGQRHPRTDERQERTPFWDTGASQDP